MITNERTQFSYTVYSYIYIHMRPATSINLIFWALEKMLHMWHTWTLMFVFTRLRWIDSIQINFHLTDLPDHANQPTRHHCLEVTTKISDEKHIRQIISYCLTEYPLTSSSIKSTHSPEMGPVRSEILKKSNRFGSVRLLRI